MATAHGETARRRRGAAVVTGASSGIGLAFARNLARRGHPLVAVARRADRLDDLARWARSRHGVDVVPVRADLRTRRGLRLAREAVSALPAPPEVVVLNAGYGSRGPFTALDREHEADMVRLNCVAVTDLAGHVLPGMVTAGRGALVVVSSAAALQPIPNMATYAATKAFELHFAEALAGELAGTGVRALAICPGPTRTEFATAAGSRVALPIPYDEPDMVVRAAWRALAAGRARAPVGAVARLALLGRALPRRAVVAVAGAAHRTTRPPAGEGHPRGEVLTGGPPAAAGDRRRSRP